MNKQEFYKNLIAHHLYSTKWFMWRLDCSREDCYFDENMFQEVMQSVNALDCRWSTVDKEVIGILLHFYSILIFREYEYDRYKIKLNISNNQFHTYREDLWAAIYKKIDTWFDTYLFEEKPQLESC